MVRAGIDRKDMYVLRCFITIGPNQVMRVQYFNLFDFKIFNRSLIGDIVMQSYKVARY